MSNIQTLVVGEMQTNCYLVSSEGSPGTVERTRGSSQVNPKNDCLIIDPGDEADYITQVILENKLNPTAIVLTHGHFDHVLGCLELKLNFDVPIFLHKNDLKLYSSANQSALHWLKRKTLKVPPVGQFIKEGDKIKIGEEVLRVIETPGHTPGSICFYHQSENDKRAMSNDKYLFTGDTIFKDGVGRTDFSYSRPLQLTKSLEKIRKLPPETIIYPGHGEPTTIGAQRPISS